MGPQTTSLAPDHTIPYPINSGPRGLPFTGDLDNNLSKTFPYGKKNLFFPGADSTTDKPYDIAYELQPEFLNNDMAKDDGEKVNNNQDYGTHQVTTDTENSNVPTKEGKASGNNRKGNKNNGKGGNKKNSNTAISPDESLATSNTSSPPLSTSTKGKKEKKVVATQNSLDDGNKSSSNGNGIANKGLSSNPAKDAKESDSGPQTTNTDNANDSKTSSR